VTDLRRRDSTVLAGDVATAVRALKAKPGRELQVHGSGAPILWLLDNYLVDEIDLFLFPRGSRPGLFPKTGPDKIIRIRQPNLDNRRPSRPSLHGGHQVKPA